MYRPNPAPQNSISFLTCEVGTAHHPYDHCWKVCSVSAVLEAASPHKVGSYLRSPMREVYQLWCWKAAQLIECLPVMLKYLGFNSYPCLNWAWGCMPVIQALGMWLEEDQKLEVILGCILS